ncbi:MAG: hypothetical protein OEV30_13410 [Ignavibacteria bacterium]|nr:hypothetical protein [Ignavibacteria bacterium]
MIGYRMFGLFCCLGCFASGAYAGDGTSAPVMTDQPVPLTGNIQVDFFGPTSMAFMEQDTEGETSLVPDRKSPWLAAGMSLLIPGSGELYAESYWKAAAFFAVSVTAWTVAYTQNQKGDDQTKRFEGYANQNWNVRQYAEWTLDHATSINPGVDLTQHQGVLVGDMDVNWAALNALERDLGNWYSHTLPAFGEQQYYELIGKYQQYYQGWADADPSLTTYPAIDAKLNAGGTQFTYYSGERGKANDYYSTSSTAVTIAVVTHLLSSADAAWTASSYNKQIDAGVGFKKAMDGPAYVSYPALEIMLKF